MSFVAVGITAGVVGAGMIGYGAYEGQNGPSAPGYKPIKTQQLQQTTAQADREAYAASDADFAARHPEIVSAENGYFGLLPALGDQSNRAVASTSNYLRQNKIPTLPKSIPTVNTTLTPELQNEFMRAGLGSSLGAFGDTGTQLSHGSAAEAGVARNLGLDIAGFQQQQLNQNNQILNMEEGLANNQMGLRSQAIGQELSQLGENQSALNESEGLAPRRTFGMTGRDIAGILTNQNLNENNLAQSQWATKYNANQAQSGAMISAGGSIAGAGMGGMSKGGGGGGGGGGMCCFIFLEAYNGNLPASVRAIRDLAVTPRRNRGYRKQASWLVPAMQTNRSARLLTNWLMIKPLTSFGEWFVGNNAHGWMFFPFVLGWFAYWNATGTESPCQN